MQAASEAVPIILLKEGTKQSRGRDAQKTEVKKNNEN
jgi:hypothetical protein